MPFGQEHQNVRSATVGGGNLLLPVEAVPDTESFSLPGASATGPRWAAFVRGANLNAQHLQSILDAVSAQGGGTVFFPPGRYYIGRSGRTWLEAQTTDAPDILVHPNVALEFAPGAVLVPMNFERTSEPPRARPGGPVEGHLVIVEIQGSIVAGLHEIFATTLYPRPVPDAAPYEPDHRAGKIVFTGNKVREVYPEWWGVLTLYEGHWGVRNRRAFQAAIDAGHTDRYRLIRDASGWPWDGERRLRWRQQSTIPVVAMYEYYIEGGLKVGLTEDGAVNPAPFVMRGGCEPTVDNTTLRAMVDPSRRATVGLSPSWANSPMLAMDGLSSFYLEGVSFDGNNLVRQAVTLTLGAQGGVGQFERCVFKNLHNTDDATLVTIRTPPRNPTTPGEPVHLAFTACRLTPILLDYNPTGAPSGRITYAERLRGMLLDYDDHCALELRACHLQGVCDPMIHAQRGRFAMNECVFHGNRRVHSADPGPGGADGEWRRFWNSTSGTDIFIDRPRRIAGFDDAPASFTAREHESQSFQFVSTWMDSDPAVQNRNGSPPTGQCASYVLINVHHTAAPAGSSESDMSQGGENGGGADPHPFPVEQFRPSISWEGPGQIGCHFIAMGCCFKSTYPGAQGRTSAQLGGVRLGPNHTGTIFHVGNTTADPISDPTTDPSGMLDFRGPFMNTRDAVAPRSFIRWNAIPGGIREPHIIAFDVVPVR